MSNLINVCLGFSTRYLNKLISVAVWHHWALFLQCWWHRCVYIYKQRNDIYRRKYREIPTFLSAEISSLQGSYFSQISFEITFKNSMPDVSKHPQRHLLKMPSKRIFLNFQKKILFTFIYLFLAFFSKCCTLIFSHKIVSVWLLQ